MKPWFTSDWHLGEDRIGIDGKPNLFYRPFVHRSFSNDPKSVIYLQNEAIWSGFLSSEFEDGDTLWHLGDVLYSEQGKSIEFLTSIRRKYPNSKFNLIIGNYDEDKLDLLGKYFDDMSNEGLVQIGAHCECIAYLNHYPISCKNRDALQHLNITGHIHGLWKVQRNMINVGVDAWHYRPVSEDEILFCWNAMQKFYDENVFPYN